MESIDRWKRNSVVQIMDLPNGKPETEDIDKVEGPL